MWTARLDWTLPAEPYDFDSSHRTLAQVLARLKSYWSSGLISGTEKVFFMGESTMAALRRTEDTEAAAPHRGNVRRRDGGGERVDRGGGEREEDHVMQNET